MLENGNEGGPFVAAPGGGPRVRSNPSQASPARLRHWARLRPSPNRDRRLTFDAPNSKRGVPSKRDLSATQVPGWPPIATDQRTRIVTRAASWIASAIPVDAARGPFASPPFGGGAGDVGGSVPPYAESAQAELPIPRTTGARVRSKIERRSRARMLTVDRSSRGPKRPPPFGGAPRSGVSTGPDLQRRDQCGSRCQWIVDGS
jgi:hypothetical protein